MDVINKLYSSVTSTVSQLSGVLPGNPVTREFEATDHIASAGPGLQWKIFRGFKKSTKQEAAIFVFEKRQLERWSRDDREMMLESLKRGIAQLTKIRHPQILTVQHPLEESRESLAFATEPVYASLANILGNTTNMPQPVPSGIANYKLYEVEIKYGLQQVCEGLTFLHSDVKLLHRNICPESIVINQMGAWKIFGFDFCVVNQNTQDSIPFWPFVEYNTSWHCLNQPSLDYIAPEYALIANHSAASDVYSLGMLIYALHGPAGKPIKSFDSYGQFKKYAQELKNGKKLNLQCVVDGLREYVKLMLQPTPEMRPDLHQFVKIPFFEDIGVKTLSYLDSLFQWDNLQKSKFFKGLPQIIQKLPHRICLYRILPCLVKEFINPSMVPFVLPNVLLIAENCSKDEYDCHILAHLKPIMKMQEPIQILLIFMQKMELVLKLTPSESIKNDVLPMLYRALESDSQQIQELCLVVLPTFASRIDYPSVKNALLPRIKKLCISTQFVSVRVNCLLCIGKLLEHLDKWLVLDEVLPFLPLIPSREPAVLMGILGIYKLALTHKKLGITKELMANKIIPFLMPLCIENGLTLNQFNALLAIVKDMIGRVEIEHRGKLEQLNSIQQEHKSFDMNLQMSTGPLVQAPQPPSDLDQMFSGLGLDNYINASPNHTSSEPEQQIFTNANSNGNDLTLQDKQRIVKEQETAHYLQSQPSLRPTLPLNKPPTIPKDLTSSLIQSNLNQINISTSTNQVSKTPNYNPNNTNWPLNSPPGNSPQSSQNWQSKSNNLMSPNSQSVTNSNSWTTNTNSWTGNTQNSNFGSFQSSQSSWNNANNTKWTPLDSLLPTQNTKIPINSMVTSQPLLGSHNMEPTGNKMYMKNNDTVSKMLSKDEIFDLLN